LYPETANIRLEEMDAIFGDATSVMPTPATLAEAESLFSRGSPVPSLDIRRQNITADHAIPGLDIEPPIPPKNGKGAKAEGESSEGLGGWISNIVKRAKGNGEGDSQSGRYRRLDQDDEDT
jgi:hypothetical protein